MEFSDFVVKFQQRFFRRFVLVKQILALPQVFLPLFLVKGQLVLERRIPGLEQHGVGDLDGIRDFLGFLSDMAFLGQRRQPFKLLLLQQADAVKITLNHLFLLVRLADFVIVGRDASDVIKHLPTFIGGHFRQACNVALQHDVVAVGTGIRRTEQAVEHLLRAVFTVEFVGGHRIVGGCQSDASRHADFLLVKGQATTAIAHHRVGKDERDGTLSGRLGVLPAVEDQIRRVLGTDYPVRFWPEDELNRITAVRFPRPVRPGDGRKTTVQGDGHFALERFEIEHFK